MPILAIILYLGSIIGSGALAWNISEPKTFFGAIGFVILWGILGTLFSYGSAFVLAAIDNNKL